MVTNTEEDEDSQEDTINYKAQYRSFKRKLKFLIYVSNFFYYLYVSKPYYSEINKAPSTVLILVVRNG